MSKRKTAKDYRKELQEINEKKLRLKNQIAKRVKELVDAHPDVLVDEIKIPGDTFKVYVRDYQSSIHQLGIGPHLELIEKIEAHLASMHPHQQIAIDYPVVNVQSAGPTGQTICNCDARDMPVYEEDGKRWCPQCGYEVV